jgi:T5orf172 domain
MGENNTTGYIYILSNPSMPSLLKIGWTLRNAKERAVELSRATGIPGQFRVEYEIYVGNPDKIEKIIHSKLDHRRWNKNREFFQISLDEAKSLLDSFDQERIGRDEQIEYYISEALSLLENSRYLINKNEPFLLLERAISMGSSDAALIAAWQVLDSSVGRSEIKQVRHYALQTIELGEVKGYELLVIFYSLIEKFEDAAIEFEQYVLKQKDTKELRKFIKYFMSNYGEIHKNSDIYAFGLLNSMETSYVESIDLAEITESNEVYVHSNFIKLRSSKSSALLGRRLLQYYTNASDSQKLGAYHIASVVNILTASLVSSDTEIKTFYKNILFDNLDIVPKDDNERSAVNKSLLDYVTLHKKVNWAGKVDPGLLFPAKLSGYNLVSELLQYIRERAERYKKSEKSQYRDSEVKEIISVIGYIERQCKILDEAGTVGDGANIAEDVVDRALKSTLGFISKAESLLKLINKK